MACAQKTSQALGNEQPAKQQASRSRRSGLQKLNEVRPSREQTVCKKAKPLQCLACLAAPCSSRAASCSAFVVPNKKSSSADKPFKNRSVSRSKERRTMKVGREGHRTVSTSYRTRGRRNKQSKGSKHTKLARQEKSPKQAEMNVETKMFAAQANKIPERKPPLVPYGYCWAYTYTDNFAHSKAKIHGA
eukprot:6207403-Pleurochrysis_carterae.AAC.4